MTSTLRLLLVEDDPDQRLLVADILENAGFLVSEAGTVKRALELFETTPLDLVLSDWRLPDGDGLSILEKVRERLPDTAFVMVTAYGTIARAVEAIRRGADDYLAKPFERQTLLLAVDKALRARRLQGENRRLAEELGERDRLVDLVGRAPSMQRLFRQVEKLAGTDATILVTGESGTGKELAARALHALSSRSKGPFVAVNCAAIPETLVEAEFFGVEKGAFTGAERARAGRMEQANGGTLFLDEVGELPLLVQPKLLRALQEGRFSRIGEVGERSSDIRLIAATNRHLKEEVAAGRFREDLYYRLAVVPLRMPPLRDRKEDIPRLVDHFQQRAARRYGLKIEPLAGTVMRRLLDHHWPGNVRELGNTVERLVLLAEGGRASIGDLPEEVDSRARGSGGFQLPPSGLAFVELERSLLEQALDMAHGNRARAARLLQLPYKAFLYRLEKHGLNS